MPNSLKRNSLLVGALAALFYWMFMFAKHDHALRDIIPFGEDPYDAVGSFGVIAGVVIGIISVIRAFRPYRTLPTQIQQVYLIRSHTAIPLLVLITMAADAVALARHSARWITSSSRNELLILIAGMTLAAAIALLIVRARHLGRRSWKAATITVVLVLLVLVVFPEYWINNLTAHLFTVLIGDVILFAAMRSLLFALVPIPASEMTGGTKPVGRQCAWPMVTGVGILVGLFAFLGEMSEGAAVPLPRLILLGCVFFGLAIAGLLIAYTFLRQPLGLGTQRA